MEEGRELEREREREREREKNEGREKVNGGAIILQCIWL